MPTTGTVLSLGIVTVIAMAWGWDWYVLGASERGITLSAEILRVCRAHPVIPFLLGLLGGHLLWPQ